MSNSTFTNYLRELRKVHNYNQEYVASALNISRQTYSHYETGYTPVPHDVCHKLASFYKVKAASLYEMLLCENDCINNDTSSERSEELEQLIDYLNYISDKNNCTRFEKLPKDEKDFLYYYEHISQRDKNEILQLLKIKFQNPDK